MLAVLRLFDIETPTARTVQSILAIALGTAFTTMAAPNLSVSGLAMIFLSSFSEAGRLVLTQKLLVNSKFSVLEGQYFLAPVASACLLSLAAVLELPNVFAAPAVAEMEGQVNSLITSNTALLFLQVSTLGVLVNYLSYVVIQEVGSLSFKLLGTVRNVGLIAWGVCFMGEELTINQYAGYSISLGGLVAYTIFQYNKQEASRHVNQVISQEEGAVSERNHNDKETSDSPQIYYSEEKGSAQPRSP